MSEDCATASTRWDAALFQPIESISARTYLFLALSGLATAASWVCYFRALQLGEVAKVAPIDKLSVVLVAVLGTVFLGEHLTWRNWAGVVGGMVFARLRRDAEFGAEKS